MATPDFIWLIHVNSSIFHIFMVNSLCVWVKSIFLWSTHVSSLLCMLNPIFYGLNMVNSHFFMVDAPFPGLGKCPFFILFHPVCENSETRHLNEECRICWIFHRWVMLNMDIYQALVSAKILTRAAQRPLRDIPAGREGLRGDAIALGHLVALAGSRYW